MPLHDCAVLSSHGQKCHGESGLSRLGRSSLWPLEILDLADPEQMRAVYDVVWESPLALEYLFDHSTFLPGAGIIDVNPSQYMACGQELAGHQLFGLCFGFSGTPNDLLPQAMGKCAYAEGDDGKILDTLSRPEVVTVQEVDAWSPHSLLDFIAKAISSDGRPKYHALIDTGALITGMTNREVATYLLQNGLKGLEGVVLSSASHSLETTSC
ncbi:unnamed protein product [Symbiodinium necroappetens]|uniref:Uncharacterized protein n=1 Tax=Symbiodinium necroappetens TaxID=1628268 RepID=A0A812QRC8_9DINO|nr:unnamed protein product [Symbiodinium necroappetens]